MLNVYVSFLKSHTEGVCGINLTDKKLPGSSDSSNRVGDTNPTLLFY